MKIYNIKKMKTRKLIIAFTLAVLPLFTFAQSVFDKYEDMEDVSTVVVSKRAFELMSKIGTDSKEAKEYVDMIRNLKSLKVFATESASIAQDMKSKVSSYLKSSNLSELMRVKDKEGNVKIYVREGRDADHVSELFMFVQGMGKHVGDKDRDRKPEAVIVSITGDIDLNKISELTSKMNIEGGEHLKKVKKKNK